MQHVSCILLAYRIVSISASSDFGITKGNGGSLSCGKSGTDAVSTGSEFHQSKSVLSPLGANNIALPPDVPQPLRYSMLNCKQGDPLPVVKLRYLVAARRCHPEIGGDAEQFLRISLAYQDCLKDYGIERVNGRVVNFGNFQASHYDARNYIEARARIKQFIPLSTLEEHIAKLEAAQSSLSADMEHRLTANNTESMWLLEDIDKVTGTSSESLVMLEEGEDGSVAVKGEKNASLQELEGAHDALRIEASKEGIRGGDTGTSQPGTPPPPPSSGAGEQGGSDCSSESPCTPSEPVKSPVVDSTVLRKADIITLNTKNVLMERQDLAGEAARAATEMMNNTNERKDLMWAVFRLLGVIMFLSVVGFFILFRWNWRRIEQKQNPTIASNFIDGTFIPWWGNDVEYEHQVKRIFVDEWKRSRSEVRREHTLATGLSREGLPETERTKLDAQIFSVTADRVRQMKELVDTKITRKI